MRLRLIIFLISITASFISIAQKADTVFQKDWMAVDTLLIKKGLTKTALEKVNVVYQKAIQQRSTKKILPHGQMMILFLRSIQIFPAHSKKKSCYRNK